MKLIKVGAATLNQTPLAWKQNKENILQAIALAKKEDVSVLCLPELCITGYGCEDAFHSSGLIEIAWQVLHEILPATDGILVSVGLPILYRNGIFNAASLIGNRTIFGFVAKRYLAGEGVHYEPRWFKPWPQGRRADLKSNGETYPLGDLYFEVSDIKIGFEICEDAWVARRPGSELSLRGVDLILNPSASHFAFDKYEVRKRFVLEGSRAFNVSYIYTNLLGCEAGRAIYDGGALIASGGKLLAAGERFSFQDVVLTSAIVDLSVTRMNQARVASFLPTFEENPSVCVSAEFDFPYVDLDLSKISAHQQAWEESPTVKEEEFTRAVALGLFDYLRKSKTRGYVVSLSGGADSSAVSCLVALMVELAISEIGVEGFLNKLDYIARIQETKEPRQIIKALLTCVYQATRYSGEETRNAARTLSEALGAAYFEFDINDLVDHYVRIISESIGRRMSWETDDICLQNIQARVRAPGLWLLANERNALLLSTSNRSEAAVGYATMDGDTCGGLCPIGGIDKAFLRRWLRWLEREGPIGLHPVPTLSLVNQQAPTAELRPRDFRQTDETDLMPYDLLDAIERAAIRDKKTPIEVFQLMRVKFGNQYASEDLGQWVERFFLLWSRNQWKRERYAPSFHLDDQNLDPKTWCRFPILSGGFERELADLRAFLRKTTQRRSKGSLKKL